MEFEILYCKPCGYRTRAEDLAAELRERFGAQVSIEEGKFGRKQRTSPPRAPVRSPEG
jgi:hypothetical protein